MHLSSAQKQRAIGAVLGMACGDALGAGYEFTHPGPDADIEMVGGGAFRWAPGEWTDDTSMAIPILDELAAGADLLDPATMDRVALRWADWTREATDVGNHTRLVFGSVPRQPTAAQLTAFAAQRFADGHSSAGNGTLMRTGPIVLGYLDDPAGLTEAATAYALMTHGDPEGAEACVLWNHAQRTAIVEGVLDIRAGLGFLPADRRERWEELIAQAQAQPAESFDNNGWVVHAFAAAWSAIHRTPVPEGVRGPQHLADALVACVRAGGDTDTVAAIAGGLLGAAWGVSAIPSSWRRMLHGWPEGTTGQDLLRRAALASSGGEPDPQGWPTAPRMEDNPGEPLAVPHPHDDGVWIGDLVALEALPDGVDAVVSLCRLGTAQSPAAGIGAQQHVEIWLIDSAQRKSNPHLEFVLADAAKAVKDLRDEGRTVFLHCVHAHSRTPSVAAVYAAEHLGVEPSRALREVCAVLPNALPNDAFQRVVDDWRAVWGPPAG